MELRIHRNFITSLKQLTLFEQKSIQRIVNQINSNELTSGMRFHKVGHYISISPNLDLRIIALESKASLTLLHVDHHDKAYEWAEKEDPSQSGKVLNFCHQLYLKIWKRIN